MLRLLQKQESVLSEFCERDVFGTRISAYYKTYGTAFPFALFYLQETDGQITAALCRIDGDMTLCCNDNSDFEEINEFISAIGYSSLLCDTGVCAKLKKMPIRSGLIVEFNDDRKIYNENYTDCIANSFDLSDIYDILNCSGFEGLADKSSWLSDVYIRLNHGTAYIAHTIENGKTVACAMVLFETEKAALIGAVATLPEYRGKGYASTLVDSLAKGMNKKGKRVELLCVNNSIINFYNKLSFYKTGEWAIV